MSRPNVWNVAHGRAIQLDVPRLMGVLNVTPDSFSDGGEHNDPQRAIDRAFQMRTQGAEIIDVGGESTRPGAERVRRTEQIARTVPVITGLVDAGYDGLISIDTTHAPVARAAIEAGAHIINDVSAGAEDCEIAALAVEAGAGLVLMHRLVSPDRDSYSHSYDAPPDYGADVVDAVRTSLARSAELAMDAGVEPQQIVLDPGLGFGKTVEQNFELISRISELGSLGFPLLSAASRKSFLGAVTGVEDPAVRVSSSVAVTVAHAFAGVRLFRVHDVREHHEALVTAASIMRSDSASADRGGC